jgi:hypothetical protein
MKKLIQLLTLLCLLFQATYFIAQSNLSLEQNIPLTKKNLTSIFYEIKNNTQFTSVWTACNKDSSYYKSDTVILYSNKYFQLTAKCCQYIEWTFSTRTTLDLTELFNCNEPPYSEAGPFNNGLKIKFKKNKKNKLILSIYENGKFKDRFTLLSLDTVELQKGILSYRLTMVRKKYILVNESW